jgi:iron(III) transport system substrate-binding protein
VFASFSSHHSNHNSRHHRIGVVLVIVTIFGLSGCVGRSESDVVVYSALDQEFAQPILSSFERSTENKTTVIGKFDVESTKTVGLVNLIITEQDRPNCDLFWNNEIMHTVRLQKLGLLQEHSWQVGASHPPGMIASDGTWCGFAARARVLIINKNLIKNEDDYPTSVSDLNNPRWKDQCAMARPLFGTTATHFAVLREINGKEETINELKAINANAKILSGNKQVAMSVSAGTLAWGLTDTDDAIIEKDQGRNVAIVFPDQQPDQLGTLRIPNAIGIIKNAKHPVAAAMLADFLVRPETEDRLAMGNSAQMPLSRKSKFPPRVLPSEPVRWMNVDFEKAATGWEEWAAEIQTIFD